jgi:hypothetical protein
VRYATLSNARHFFQRNRGIFPDFLPRLYRRQNVAKQAKISEFEPKLWEIAVKPDHDSAFSA